MVRSTINQVDIERILRAAAKVGSKVEIDMRSMVVTVVSSGLAFALSEMGQIEEATSRSSLWPSGTLGKKRNVRKRRKSRK